MGVLDIGKEMIGTQMVVLIREEAVGTAGARSRYAGSSAGSRSLALTLTIALHILAAGALLVKWGHDRWLATEAAPLVATFDVAAAPPEPAHELPEGPEKVEQKEQELEQRKVSPVEVPPSALPPMLLVPAPPEPKPAVVAADPVAETTAPKSLPAPPASRLSSDAEASWQTLLLAHLEEYRRYPASARARRWQGVAHVRFSMTRAGQLVAAEIISSSGSAALDKAALETIRRAAPFPQPPDDVTGNSLELVVPVEFFLR